MGLDSEASAFNPEAAGGAAAAAAPSAALLDDPAAALFGGDAVAAPAEPTRHEITELGRAGQKAQDVSMDIILRFKVQRHKQKHFTELWNSQGTMSQAKISIWVPLLDKGMSKRNRKRICLGHYANRGFANPLVRRRAAAAACCLSPMPACSCACLPACLPVFGPVANDS